MRAEVGNPTGSGVFIEAPDPRVLTRLQKVTREAIRTVRMVERAAVGDVVGRYTLEDGEAVSPRFADFLETAVAEGGGRQLTVIVVAHRMGEEETWPVTGSTPTR